MSTNHRNIEATSMKTTIVSFARKALNDQRGQVLPWVALGLIGMLGMGGMSVDVGRAYVAHAQLQNYANAAVLAAAGLVYNTSSTNNATTEANLYSGSSGDENVNNALGTVTTTVSTVCLLAAAERDYLPIEQPSPERSPGDREGGRADVFHETVRLFATECGGDCDRIHAGAVPALERGDYSGRDGLDEHERYQLRLERDRVPVRLERHQGNAGIGESVQVWIDELHQRGSEFSRSAVLVSSRLHGVCYERECVQQLQHAIVSNLYAATDYGDLVHAY
jgi:hypothetical protein